MKNFPNSFASTDLHQYLQGLGAKKIVLVGYMVSAFFPLIRFGDAANFSPRLTSVSPPQPEPVLSLATTSWLPRTV